VSLISRPQCRRIKRGEKGKKNTKSSGLHILGIFAYEILQVDVPGEKKGAIKKKEDWGKKRVRRVRPFLHTALCLDDFRSRAERLREGKEKKSMRERKKGGVERRT